MKIKQEEVSRVCLLILERLKEKKMILFKTDEKKVHEALVGAFLKNIQEEEEIDQAAQSIFEKSVSELDQGLDRQKMLLMIKRKLAREKGFIL